MERDRPSGASPGRASRGERGQGHGFLTMQPIYLDYNASTPVDARVAAAMRPFLEDHYGNPSSGHWAATEGRAALDSSRGQVAALLGCHHDEVVFTSGGSEANNLALKGAFFALRDKGNHIITTRIEHPAIVAPCHFLERLGAGVPYLPVDSTGRLDPDDLRKRSRRARSLSASCTPTMRSEPFSQSRTVPVSPTSTASCSTPTRRNPSARSRPMSTNSASVCFRSPATRFMRQKGWGRCLCVAASRSNR